MFGERDCFLTETKWEAVRQRCSEVLPSVDNVLLHLSSAMAHIPALLRAFRQFMRSEMKGRERILFLMSRVHALINLLRRDKVKLSSDMLDPDVVGVVSNASGQLPPAWLGTLFRFPTPEIARRYIVYWSSVIVSFQLKRHLYELYVQQVGPIHDSSFNTEAREAARNIYRSVHYMHEHSPFGAFPMCFAFSAAFSVDLEILGADELYDRKQWILSNIDTLLATCGVKGMEYPLGYMAQYLSGKATSTG